MQVIFRPSPIHGTGAFALAHFPKGSRVIEYLGCRISKAESDRQCQLNNRFIFYLNEEFDLDGDVDFNPARFLNHSCAPTCEAELIEGHIWVVAKRDIRKGEEITFNYGYDLTNYREFPCSCGAPTCVGYIVAEEFHGLVRRENGR